MSASTAERIVVVGGGFAGLAITCRLAHEGVPVTLLEASELGANASLRNQGWLHSGGWFARTEVDLARKCYESLQQTLAYCPECIEPNHEGMYYLITRSDTIALEWTVAWEAAQIPFHEVPRERLLAEFPLLETVDVRKAYLLPDRSFRADVLLARLATDARQAGAEIREHSPVVGLLDDEQNACGVITGAGENIRAKGVIFATGAWDWYSQLTSGPSIDEQALHERVALKTHLVALRPGVGQHPFCVVDQQGFNHLPHADASVFGTDRWFVVRQSNDTAPLDQELAEIWRLITKFFPSLSRERCAEVKEWAGTTLQVMHADQVQPGKAPRPTVIDHKSVSPNLGNLWSVTPGRATLWVHLAEEIWQRVAPVIGERTLNAQTPPWA